MMNRIELEDKAAFGEMVEKAKLLQADFGQYLNDDAHSLILYLITLYKFGQHRIPNNPTADTIKNQYNSLAVDFDKENGLTGLNDCFLPFFQTLNPQLFLHFTMVLNTINTNFFNKYFPELFEQLLQDFFSAQGRRSGEIIMPFELSRFMCNIADLPNNGIAYNPFSGLASFALHLSNNSFYLGQEKYKNVWALGVLRLYAYPKNKEVALIQGDSIKEWQGQQKYDLIISQPPFGLKPDDDVMGMFGKIRSVEQFVIERGIESLKTDGKLIICIPQNVLFSSAAAESKMRRFLIEEDLLEMVVSFPEGILNNTRIPVVIIVLSKAKRKKGVVDFVNATEYIQKNSRMELKLDDYALLSGIQGLIASNSVHTVSNIEIADNNFILTPNRYFQKEQNGTKLKELGFFSRGKKANPIQVGKFVRIRDLKDRKFEYELEVENIESTEIPKYAYKIEESCLLLAVKWRTLKPTLFVYSGTAIFISSDIVAFHVDESKVNIKYLINELNSDNVSAQLDAFRNGTTIPSIKLDDLSSIKIQLPDSHYQQNIEESLKEQAYIVKKLLENKRAEMITQIELEGELQRIITEQKNDLSIKKHNIMQHLNNVRESSKLLYDIMIKNRGVLEASHVLNPNTGTTVEKRFKRLIESINESLFFVDNITNEMSWDNKKEFNINELLGKAIDKGQVNSNLFEIDYYFDEQSFQILADTGGEEEEVQNLEPLAEVSEKDFFEVYNNILENAICHGFTQPNKKYKFRIELLGAIDRGLGKYLTINFLNNGSPLPAGMAERYCIKGEKAGPTGKSGIGTWKVCEIVQQHFKGKVTVHDLKGGDFPVKIEIQLPWSIFKNL